MYSNVTGSGSVMHSGSLRIVFFVEFASIFFCSYMIWLYENNSSPKNWAEKLKIETVIALHAVISRFFRNSLKNRVFVFS